ncbi:hypothetical protein D3C79_634450 [compost metagenome]
MTNLFTTENGMVSSGANKLDVTATLTNVSNNLATVVFEKIMERLDAKEEGFEQRIGLSQKDNDALDTLIAECANLSVTKIDFLKEATEDVLERALKSQQSKRSRTKSKNMTKENYKTLISAAIAEHLIRLGLDKPKGANVGASAGSSTLSDKEIEKLRGDVAAINKAIRNVQSRKSIAKSKLDFDETSERYQAILAQEVQLKQLRDEANGIVDTAGAEAIEKQEKLKELVMNISSKDLKIGDARALIDNIQVLLKDDEPEITTTDENTEEQEEAGVSV